MAICSSILKEDNKTLIVSPDEERRKEAKVQTGKLLQQGNMVGLNTYATDKIIKFKNGSTIEFVVPIKEGNIIRGKRSKLPMLLYDYEYSNHDDIDEVIKTFMNNIDN